MPEFGFRAATSGGDVVSGRTEASTREDALRYLRAQGLVPLCVNELGDGAEEAGHQDIRIDSRRRPVWRLQGLARKNAITYRDIQHVTQELSIMLNAGLALDRALKVLAQMSAKPAVADLLNEVQVQVKAGKSLSQALIGRKDVFGSFYVGMVQSGEAIGQLPRVFKNLKAYMDRGIELRNSTTSMLMYPLILVVVATVSVLFMLLFVVPQFEQIFTDLGDAIPLSTQVLLNISRFVADWGGMAAASCLVVGLFIYRWCSSASNALLLDRLTLKVPLIGELVRKFELTRFTHCLGMLLHSGVPMVEALRIAVETIENRCIRARVSEVSGAIKQGRAFGDVASSLDILTPMELNLLKLGDETGRLDELLLELSTILDAETERGVKRLLALAEPLLIVVMGALVAGIVISIMLGIMSISDIVI